MATREQVRDENSPRITHLENQVRLFESALRKEKLAKGELVGLLKQILSSVTMCDPVKIEYKKRTRSKSKHACSAVLHFTDWHIGKNVLSAEVNEFNAYSYEIARKRIEYIINAKINETYNERKYFDINELVILSTGDMINGALRDGDISTNEFPICVQPVKASELWASSLIELSKHFKIVRVEWDVPDNHGRMGKKIEWAEPWNSFNYLVSELVKAKVANQKNIVINIHPGVVGETIIQGKKYLFRHGHGMTKAGGSFSGIPFYNIDRYLAQETLGRMGLGSEYQFYKLVIGHFHVEYKSRLARISNSLSGTDNFDRSQGRYGVPGQPGWLVHPEFGEKNYNLYEVGGII